MEKIFENGKLILQPKTDLTASRVRELVDKAKQFISEDSQATDVVLDIANVRIIDSIGVSFVIGLYKSSINSGKKFKVSGVNQDIRKLFTLMKLDSVFDI